MNKLVKNTNTKFNPIPKFNRFNIYTRVFCLDELPDNYIVEKEHELFFYNDRVGFFTSNKGNIVAFCKSIYDWDTGLDDSDLVKASKESLGVVGNRICVRNNQNDSIEVYKVIGFVNADGKSNYYFNIK